VPSDEEGNLSMSENSAEAIPTTLQIFQKRELTEGPQEEILTTEKNNLFLAPIHQALGRVDEGNICTTLAEEVPKPQ
jgi:hypothetical protein